jgi:hypothetical protein
MFQMYMATIIRSFGHSGQQLCNAFVIIHDPLPRLRNTDLEDFVIDKIVGLGLEISFEQKSIF